MLKLTLFIAVLMLVADAYVRLAPSDPQQFNTIPGDFTGQAGYVALKGGAIWESAVIEATAEDGLAALQDVALATPRTKLLAGSVEAGKLTFITRSAIFGFPDYTTIMARPQDGGSQVRIYARLRFGTSDLGVNRARISAWVPALQRFAERGGDASLTGLAPHGDVQRHFAAR